MDGECPGPTYAHQSHQHGWPDAGENMEGQSWPDIHLCPALPSAPPTWPPTGSLIYLCFTNAPTEAQKSLAQSHMAGGGAELGLAQGLSQ